MAKVVATGRGKARRKRELAHCINVICVTIVVLAVTFSTFITVLYFQKSRDCTFDLEKCKHYKLVEPQPFDRTVVVPSMRGC